MCIFLLGKSFIDPTSYSFAVLCSLKIQLDGKKYRDKTTLDNKTYSVAIVLVFKAGAFRY